MSKEKGCKCCKQIWYVDMLDKKLKLCPNCYEYCKPLFDDLKIKDKQIADLEAKLAEKERQYETLYKLFSEQHEIIDQNELGCFEEVNRLLKEQKDFYVVEKTEYDKMKQGAKDIVKELKQQLAEKDRAIENWQTMYESVVQTCHNDKEEIERLNKQIETQENTITNLVEDNRASQEWYKKQLEEKEKERHEEWKTGKEWKWEWQKVNQKLEKAEQDKISFAVEKLEQVKETAECVLDNALKNSSLNQSYYDRLLDEIDNQIEELKKEMK